MEKEKLCEKLKHEKCNPQFRQQLIKRINSLQCNLVTIQDIDSLNLKQFSKGLVTKILCKHTATSYDEGCTYLAIDDREKDAIANI